MNLRGKTILLALLVTSIVVGTTSCKKRKLNRSTTTSQDNQQAESMFQDVYDVVDQAAQEEQVDGTGKTGASFQMEYTFGSDCATITVDPPVLDANGDYDPTFPKTVTVDFGNSNCEGNDGKMRRGQIEAVYTGRWRDAGTTISISTSNYYVDDFKVVGTKEVTNRGEGWDGHSFTTHTIEVEGVITSPEGTSVTWESSRTREWIEGSDTWIFGYDADGNLEWLGLDGIYDDVWEITGSGSGVNSEGRAYTLDITTALRVEWCGSPKWPEVTIGIVEIQPDDLKLRVVDFGDGSCDQKARVEIGNYKKDIDLR